MKDSRELVDHDFVSRLRFSIKNMSPTSLSSSVFPHVIPTGPNLVAIQLR